MLKHSIKALSAGAALVLAASGVCAQTATTPSGTTANPPTTNVGVDPQDAREATRKAVPRADTGTLVRTEPSAAERASDMTKDAKNAMTPDTRNTGNTGNTRNANPSEPRNSGSTTGTVNNTTTPNAAMGISGTVPGADATSGDATNMRNNPGTRVDGTNNRMSRPARADRN